MRKKKNITPHNDKCENHGYWEVYKDDGSLHFKCNWVNGKLIGYDENHLHYNLVKKRYVIR